MSCNVIVGGKGINDGRTVFPQGGSFRVEGGPGCAAPNGEVRVEAESDRSALATFPTLRDGSFRSPSITLPKRLALGPQRLVIVGEGREYGIPILIYESVVKAADGVTTPSGTSGGPSTRTAGSTAVGRPTSGSEGTIRYVFWVLLLLAAGTTLALAAMRRGWRWHSVRGTGLSLGRHRPPAPEALPVPVRSSRGSRGSVPNARTAPLQPEPVTENDELDDFLGAR